MEFLTKNQKPKLSEIVLPDGTLTIPLRTEVKPHTKAAELVSGAIERVFRAHLDNLFRRRSPESIKTLGSELNTADLANYQSRYRQIIEREISLGRARFEDSYGLGELSTFKDTDYEAPVQELLERQADLYEWDIQAMKQREKQFLRLSLFLIGNPVGAVREVVIIQSESKIHIPKGIAAVDGDAMARAHYMSHRGRRAPYTR